MHYQRLFDSQVTSSENPILSMYSGKTERELIQIRRFEIIAPPPPPPPPH